MSPIPWAAILTHAPVIVAAAERLLKNTASTRSPERPRAIETRLEALEKTSHESALLLQELAQQVQALGAAQGELARLAQRLRVAVRLGAAALILAIAALVIAVWR